MCGGIGAATQPIRDMVVVVVVEWNGRMAEERKLMGLIEYELTEPPGGPDVGGLRRSEYTSSSYLSWLI